ncbi:hypothetical protein [Ruminococcus sp.]
MNETKPNTPAEILYHFIEGQLELEPEHYPYTVAQITALETKVKANTPLTDAESETLREVLQTYMELYEYSEAEQEKVLSLLSR